jgi:L-threonylcarbamoyladenylate synthase
VILFAEADEKNFKFLIQQNKELEKKIGSITYSKVLTDIDPSPFHKTTGSSVEQFARTMYQIMRELDQKGMDVILVESVSDKGLGAAVMDRLRKAALHDG